MCWRDDRKVNPGRNCLVADPRRDSNGLALRNMHQQDSVEKANVPMETVQEQATSGGDESDDCVITFSNAAETPVRSGEDEDDDTPLAFSPVHALVFSDNDEADMDKVSAALVSVGIADMEEQDTNPANTTEEVIVMEYSVSMSGPSDGSVVDEIVDGMTIEPLGDGGYSPQASPTKAAEESEEDFDFSAPSFFDFQGNTEYVVGVEDAAYFGACPHHAWHLIVLFA